MRQAGRYLPEYRELRAEKGGFLELAYDSDAACEITLQPIRRFGFDGAILFSDILIVPYAMGQNLEFLVGEGPRMSPRLVDAALSSLQAVPERLSPIYETVRLVRAALGKVGLQAFDKVLDNGYRNITTASKAINSPADLKGFKIRVPVSPLWTSMFKAFDAAPASINFSEVYSALQTKIVEGQENPLAIISTAKLYEVQKYCSLTNHMWDGFWFLANRRAWEKLPEDIRAVVAKNINAAAINERADVAKLNANLQQELATKGLTFNQPNTPPFRDKLRTAGFYAEWKGKYGEQAWELLEKSVGKLS